MKIKTLTLAIAAATASTSAIAQTIELDTIVVTANKTEQSLQDITSNVTVITAEEIKAKHYTTVRQAIASTPGISFTSNGGAGLSGNLFIQGMESKYILVLIDGIRYNEPTALYGSPFEDLIIDNIERIEIIKGAQSGVWGADAAGGVINIITKDPEKNGTKGNISIESGSYETSKNQINVYHKADKLDLTLSRSEYHIDGMTAAATSGQDIDHFEKDPRQNITLSGKIRYHFSENTSASYLHKTIDSKTQFDAGASTQGTVENSKNAHQFESASVNHQQDNFSLRAFHNTANFNRTLNGNGWTYNGKSETIESGLEANANLGLLNLTTGFNELKLSTESNSYENTGYFLGNTSVLKNSGIVLSQSIRFDDYDAFADATTYKVGFKFPMKNDLNLSFNYGTAYKAPSISNLQANQTTTAVGIKSLKPENSESWDATLVWKGLRVTHFDNQIQDMIQYYDPTPADWSNGDAYYRNTAGQTKIQGTEVEYKITLNDFDISTSYTHLDTADTDGNFLARRPEDQIGLNIDWFATEKLDINLNGQYIGKRSEGEATDYYDVWNTVANYEFNKQFSGYIKVDNLFDKYYQVVDGYATAERSFYAGVKAKF